MIHHCHMTGLQLFFYWSGVIEWSAFILFLAWMAWITWGPESKEDI